MKAAYRPAGRPTVFFMMTILYSAEFAAGEVTLCAYPVSEQVTVWTLHDPL